MAKRCAICAIFDQETEEDFVCNGWAQLANDIAATASPCAWCIYWGAGNKDLHNSVAMEKVLAYGMHDEGKMQRERDAYYDGLLLAIMTTKKEIDNYPVG